MKRFLILTALIALGSQAQAKLNYTVNGLNDAAHLSGPKLTEKDLEGKVLFIENWGLHCPPCRASLPHMQKLYEKHSKSGKFAMIGAHLQGRDEKGILNLLKSNGVTYPVYQQFRVGGVSLPGGIPSAVLIDHKGNVLKVGSPGEVAALIDAALKAAPDPVPGSLIGGMELVHNKALAKQLVAGKNVEPHLKGLEAKAKAETPAGKEAAEIIEACQAWVEAEKQTIQSSLQNSPSFALDRIAILAKTMPSQAVDFAADYKTLNANPDIRKLATFRKDIATLSASAEKGKAQRKSAVQQANFKLKSIRPLADSAHAGVSAEAAALIATLESLVDSWQD